jgi:RNA polymerase sigma-70 factor (ECF subfamily)
MDRQCHQFYDKLKRYLQRMLKRPQDVEDIAQEAFVRVLEAGSKGEIHYQQAYLFRTAHNLALNALARKSNLLETSMADFADLDVVMESVTLDETVATQQRFERFCHIAASLPNQCRQVLVLRKVYGLSQQEVAARLGISVSTVEKHLAKGMVRCAAQLQKLENPDQPQHAGERARRPHRHSS